MSKDTKLAHNAVTPRRYDDPHPAELVTDPRHKARLYLSEVKTTIKLFDRKTKSFTKALRKVAKARLDLDKKPSLKAQQKVYDRFETLSQGGQVGLIFRTLAAEEAIADYTEWLRTAPANGCVVSFKRHAVRIGRLEAQEERIERESQKLKKRLSKEEKAIRAALPDYDAIAPQYKLISGPAF